MCIVTVFCPIRLTSCDLYIVIVATTVQVRSQACSSLRYTHPDKACDSQCYLAIYKGTWCNTIVNMFYWSLPYIPADTEYNNYNQQSHNLQDAHEREYINNDRYFKQVGFSSQSVLHNLIWSLSIFIQIFECERMKFSEIPQRLSQLLMPPDPIVINHLIKWAVLSAIYLQYFQ